VSRLIKWPTARKVRDGEGAIASTPGAGAPQNLCHF